MNPIFPCYGGRGVVDRMLLALKHPAAQHYWHRVGRLLEEQIAYAHDEAVTADAEFDAVKAKFDDIVSTW